MIPKFAIGDTAYHACVECVPQWIKCPDCQGKRYLTVILGDDSQVTIDCQGCQRGYETPSGVVSMHQYLPTVSQVTITGVGLETKEGREAFEYRGGYHCFEEENLFHTEDEAKIRADELAATMSADAMERFHSKEKPTRTWGFNATYHRNCAKRAWEEYQYHTAKLNVCKLHEKAS